MASLEEKKKALAALLDDNELAEQVISQAVDTEKSADNEGRAFKERLPQKDAEEEIAEDIQLEDDTAEEPEEEEEGTEEGETTTKAELKKRVMYELDENDNGVPDRLEKGQGAEGAQPGTKKVAVAAGKAPLKKPVPKATSEQPVEAEEEAPEEDVEQGAEEGEETELPDVVGNMSVEEFADVLADALATALEPYLEAQKEMRKELSGLSVQVTTRTKEANEARVANEKLEKQIASLGEKLAAAQEKIKELDGAVPNAARGYVPSQADDNTLSEEKAKEFGAPTEDVLSPFMQFIGVQQNPYPQ